MQIIDYAKKQCLHNNQGAAICRWWGQYV